MLGIWHVLAYGLSKTSHGHVHIPMRRLAYACVTMCHHVFTICHHVSHVDDYEALQHSLGACNGNLCLPGRPALTGVKVRTLVLHMCQVANQLSGC